MVNLPTTFPSDFEINLEPLIEGGNTNNLAGMILVLDKSRMGSCKSLSREQLTALISNHGGSVVPMLSPEVTHIFSETEKAPLPRSAAASNIPVLNSCQLAARIDTAHVWRELARFEAEEQRRQEEEREEAVRAMAAKEEMKKKAAEERKQKEMDRKRKRASRSEEGEQGGDTNPTVAVVKNEEENEKDGGLLKRVVKRVAKRRKLPAATTDQTTMVKVKEEDGEESVPKSVDVPSTPLHIKRRRFEGKVFFLLGRFERKQAEMQAFIEENGGEVAKSITRKVTHLLTAQGDDGTVAFKQARQRGLKIITEGRLNEFMIQARATTTTATTTTTTSTSTLQVPSTPVTSAAQRREHAQRVALTPLPFSSAEPIVQLSMDASPSWKVIKNYKKAKKKEKEEKEEGKKKKKSKRKHSTDKENVSPLRLSL